jgi:hypothetical protein
VQVENIDAVRFERFERFLDLAFQNFRLVHSELARVPFCGQFQPSIFVPDLSGPVLLFTSDIDSGGIDLVVALPDNANGE